MNPRLLCHTTEDWAKHLTRCTRLDQDRYIEHPIEILELKGESEKIHRKFLRDAPKRFLKQLFVEDNTPSRLRSITEQRQFLQELAEEKREAGVPYGVRDGWLQVNRAYAFDRETLRKLMELLDSESGPATPHA